MKSCSTMKAVFLLCMMNLRWWVGGAHTGEQLEDNASKRVVGGQQK